MLGVDLSVPHRMIPIKPLSTWNGTSDCKNCSLRKIALFSQLTEQELDSIHAPIDDFELASDHVLYQEGSAGAGVYTVRSGMVKLVRYSVDGNPRIVRVARAGDVLGLEALVAPTYNSEAVALTPAAVCRIPLSVVQDLNARSPHLHMQLMQRWQKALTEADDWLADLNFGTARQRVCQLVWKMRSLDNPDLVQLITLRDMGSMTDLTEETVSRKINELLREGIIKSLDKAARSFQILDVVRLRQN